VFNLVRDAAIILTSSFAFSSLPPLQATMAQVSAVSGQDFDRFQTPCYSALIGPNKSCRCLLTGWFSLSDSCVGETLWQVLLL
jgi:hypothetical protein